MKDLKDLRLILLLLSVGLPAFSQIGIGTKSPKGALDIVSTTSGFMMPRMNGDQREDLTVTEDHKGMQVYDTTSNSYWYFDGDNWVEQNVSAASVAKIVYSAEYAGASLVADGSTNIGGLTSDNASAANNWMNYYEWSSDLPTLNDYDITLRFTVPSDFSSWATTDGIVIDYQTETETDADANLSVKFYLETGETSFASFEPLTSTSWSTIQLPATQLSTLGSGQTAIIVLKLASSNNKAVRVGDVTLNYNK